jgi:hypothetical protein
MTGALLTADELQVYRLKSKNMSAEQISANLCSKDQRFTLERVQNISKEIDRKAYIAARYEVTYALLDKYLRLYRVAKDYFEEENSGIKHVLKVSQFAGL